MKGRKQSAEARQKIRIANSGENNPNFGKKFSEEWRAKISNAHKGKRCSPKGEFKKGQFLREKHPNWKGGKYSRKRGYQHILIPTHPFAKKDGYILNPHLVAEKCLGRFLEPTEITHHINFDKQDDRPENIFVFENRGEHIRFHLFLKNNPFLKTWLKSNILM